MTNVPAFHYNGVIVPPNVMVDILNDFEAYYYDYVSSTGFDMESCICDFYDCTEYLYDLFEETFEDEYDRWNFIDTFHEYINRTFK